MTDHYFEDFAVGQVFGSSRVRVEADRIVTFAAEFDPQPFHLDPAAASGTFFHGLVASGWYTAAVTMRLLVNSELRPSGGIIGLGFEELRWPRPVRPGDELHLHTEVLEARPSRSRPEHGLVKLRIATLDRADEAVQVLVGTLLVGRRARDPDNSLASPTSQRPLE